MPGPAGSSTGRNDDRACGDHERASGIGSLTGAEYLDVGEARTVRAEAPIARTAGAEWCELLRVAIAYYPEV